MTIAFASRAALAAAALLWTTLAAAEEAALQLLSHEALPSAGTDLDFAASTYEERAALTAAALAELSPRVAAAVGVDPERIDTEVTPGGYLLRTNASLQARGVMSDAEADRLAAALGYVYRQWSVLVSQPDDPAEGRTGYVALGFPEGALTPALAQAFFEHAAQVHDGLGGGYTAFGDEMLFLNVRDGDGAPYSGLQDIDFAARLGLAAGAFAQAQVKIAGAGRAEARFVGNDWAASPDGGDYAAVIGDPEALAALDGLRAEHEALVARFAERFGWR